MTPAYPTRRSSELRAAGEAEARQLPRHALVILVVEGIAQIGQDLSAPARRWRVGEIEPHGALRHPHGIDPQPVAAIEIGAVAQVELDRKSTRLNSSH